MKFEFARYERAVTTTSEAAQDAFNTGLVWHYGYNHEADAESFQRAIDANPRCGQAYWGVVLLPVENGGVGGARSSPAAGADPPRAATR